MKVIRAVTKVLIGGGGGGGYSYIRVLPDRISFVIIWRAKLLKCDWLMRRAFFLNSGQKLIDPDWLRRFILSIRTKYQKYTQ